MENFAEDGNDNFSDSADYDGNESSDKENLYPLWPSLLQNPRKQRGKERPLGTKRFKSTCKTPKSTVKHQRWCKKCEGIRHYQKNCKVVSQE